MGTPLKIALLGNPNTGKSTIFNELTGLNQKIGNFAGVTIDKKIGCFCLPDDQKIIEVIDLPGIYSLYAKSKDENIAFETLCDKKLSIRPDMVVLVTDASNLKRNLLLCTQVADLGLPMILVLNMIDIAEDTGIQIDTNKLAHTLGVRVIPITAKEGKGIAQLKQEIAQSTLIPTQNTIFKIPQKISALADELMVTLKLNTPYEALQLANQHHLITSISVDEHLKIESILHKYQFDATSLQVDEAVERYAFINKLLKECVVQTEKQTSNLTSRLDNILMHRHFALPIFVFILFIVFQSIFLLAEYPMVWIENLFMYLEQIVSSILPEGVLNDLIVNGILTGIGGVVVFLPQILILFLFISILEDTGYMARVTFIMDKMMRSIGLNGKSVIPLISGLACAVPAIMGTRTIENWKDRLITIMVTPLVSCSARLPVYTLLISLAIPDKYIGWVNLQGLVLLGLYFAGFFASFIVALILNKILKVSAKGYFIMELPIYRMPRWKDIGLQLYNKARIFLWQIGRIIVAVSIILWVLAEYGPSDDMQRIEDKYESILLHQPENQEVISQFNAEKLENSYIGKIGKFIEPAIKPLGYDWKIGIALLTSFAAREAFVGTISTIYHVDNSENSISSIRQNLLQAKNSETGLATFSFPTAMSLMVFYIFAMQCVSTLITVHRETRSYKWPVIQFLYMTALAYCASWVTFQILS